MKQTIRRATIEDVNIIAPLFDGYRSFYNQPPDLSGATDFIRERLANNESVIFIAFVDEGAIGFTQLYPVFSSAGMKRAWILNDIYVTPTARKQGVAAALLNAAKEHGTITNSRWMLLQTAVNNYTAQKVYEQNGWKRVDDFIFYEVKC